jgi:hypothetical protein
MKTKDEQKEENMKSVFVKAIAIPATFYAFHVGTALATPEIQFAHCYGDHHGSYLDFVAEEKTALSRVLPSLFLETAKKFQSKGTT